MKCPVCGKDTKVAAVYSAKNHVYRQRRCVECGHKYNTVEEAADLEFNVEAMRQKRRRMKNERTKQTDTERENT